MFNISILVFTAELIFHIKCVERIGEDCSSEHGKMSDTETEIERAEFSFPNALHSEGNIFFPIPSSFFISQDNLLTVKTVL